MKVVGFYTKDPVYTPHAELLTKSLARFGIEVDLLEIEPSDWLTITGLKPTMVLNALKKWQEPVLYLDIDSVVLEDVQPYFESLVGKADMAAYYRGGELISSTVFFDYSDKTLALVEKWKQINDADINLWDQMALQLAVEQSSDISCFTLEPQYTYIFDLSRELHPGVSPVIEQLQASREGRHKKKKQTLKYRLLAPLGLKPKSSKRLQARRERLAELSKAFDVAFQFDVTP